MATVSPNPKSNVRTRLRRPNRRPAMSLRSTLSVSALLLLVLLLSSGGGGGGGMKSVARGFAADRHRAGFRSSSSSTIAALRATSAVFKFGGSSLADRERVDHVAKLILEEQRDDTEIFGVVCSAMGKTTNDLLAAGEKALCDRVVDMEKIRKLHVDTMDALDADETTAEKFDPQYRAEIMDLLEECRQLLTGIAMIRELSPKTKDQLVSYGEQCSVRIVAGRIRQLGGASVPVMSWEVGVHTDSNFGDAGLVPDFGDRIRDGYRREKLLSETEGNIPIVTGFLGKDPLGRITTLGRGGSDLTATALGAALGADEIQVWKDVDGILSCDPRIVPEALPLARVTFQEASELAYFGAQVLHPIAMQPAWKANVPVRVKNSYNRAAVGTLVNGDVVNGSGNGNPSSLVTAITYKREVTVMDIQSTQMLGAYGFLARVFQLFERHRLSVDVLASSEVSISLTLDRNQNPAAVKALTGELDDIADVTIKTGCSIVTLIADVTRSSTVLARVFATLEARGINVQMMSQGASKVNISFVVLDDRLVDAMRSLHENFFGDAIVEKVGATE